MSALLRLDGKRTFATIGRQVGVPGQNVQHVVTNSPWSAGDALRQVRAELAARPELREGGVLILDESPSARPAPGPSERRGSGTGGSGTST